MSKKLAQRPPWDDGSGSVNDQVRGEMDAMGMGYEVIRLAPTAAQHVDAYLEYHRIVGDDGGPLLSEAEYEAFRARAAAQRADRVYVTWRNASGIDCKNVGPSTACFCGHRFRQHATDNMKGKQRHAKDIRCTEPGCKCQLFEFLPAHGTWSVKCNCKHEAADHDPRTRRCRNAATCGCSGFVSSFSCSCGQPWASHQTVFESRAEREAAGRPVDNLAGGGVGYEAMGAVTSFAALADGYERAEFGDPQLPFTEAMGRLRVADPAGAERLAAAAEGRGPPVALGPPPGKNPKPFWWLDDGGGPKGGGGAASSSRRPLPAAGGAGGSSSAGAGSSSSSAAARAAGGRPGPPLAGGSRGASGSGGMTAASRGVRPPAGGGAGEGVILTGAALQLRESERGAAAGAGGGSAGASSDALARLKAQRRAGGAK